MKTADQMAEDFVKVTGAHSKDDVDPAVVLVALSTVSSFFLGLLEEPWRSVAMTAFVESIKEQTGIAAGINGRSLH